jgi:FAD:protein FMN transferase
MTAYPSPMADDRPRPPETDPSRTAQDSDAEGVDGLRPRRHRRLYDLLFVVGFVVILGLFLFGNRLFSPPPPAQVALEREVAGKWVSITAYAPKADDAKAAIETAFGRIRSVLDLAEGNDPTREIRRLNAQGRLTNPSEELWAMLQAGLTDARLTHGAFDPTAAPLTSLWASSAAQGASFSSLPAAIRRQEIDRVLAHVGANHVSLQTSPRRIVLDPGTAVDLTGIATGYALDQGLAALKSAGIGHALIVAGQVTAAMGGRPDGNAWIVALRDPQNTERTVVRFKLKDGALATVGDPGRNLDPARPIPRVIDPRSGIPATGSSSATILAPTAAQAQPLATAAFVLGPDAGLRFVNALPNVEGLLIGSLHPGTLHESAGLAAFLDTEKSS